MNWLTILVILVIAANMVFGYQRGFLRVLFSLAEWLLVLVFVSWACPYTAQFLTEQTQLPDYVESWCEESIRNAGTEEVSGIAETDIGSKLETVGLALPDSVASKVFESSEDKIDDAIAAAGNKTGQVIEQSGIYTLIAQKITVIVINAIAYVLTLAVALILVWVIGHALGVFNRIPVLGGINRALGFVAGAAEGLLVVWAAFSLIAVCAGTGWGRFLLSFIADSPVLVWLYQNNLPVNLLMMFLSAS